MSTDKSLKGHLTIPKVVGWSKDYADMENKPLINGVELIGNKTLEELGVVDLIMSLVDQLKIIRFVDVTTTPLTDNQTISSVTIDGKPYALQNGDVVIYGDKEFIFSQKDGKVHEFGSAGAIASLNQKIDTVHSTLDQKIDNTANTLNQTINTTAGVLDQAISAASSTLDSKLDNTASALDQKIDNTATSLNGSIDNVQTALNNKITADHDDLYELLEELVVEGLISEEKYVEITGVPYTGPSVSGKTYFIME